MSDQDQAARQVLDEDSVALRLLAKDAEIERLRELVAAGKEDRKKIDRLVDENLRQRELLKGGILTPIAELNRRGLTIDTQDEIINKLRYEIKLLRGEVQRKEDANGCLRQQLHDGDKQLVEKDAEIERLRELVNDLHQCGDISPDLWDRIKKEVGDE